MARPSSMDPALRQRPLRCRRVHGRRQHQDAGHVRRRRLVEVVKLMSCFYTSDFRPIPTCWGTPPTSDDDSWCQHLLERRAAGCAVLTRARGLSHAFFGARPRVYVDAETVVARAAALGGGARRVESSRARLAAFPTPRTPPRPCRSGADLGEFDAIQPHQTWRLDELQPGRAVRRCVLPSRRAARPAQPHDRRLDHHSPRHPLSPLRSSGSGGYLRGAGRTQEGLRLRLQPAGRT